MGVFEELHNAGLTNERYEECLRLILDKKNGVTDIDWKEICERYNLPMAYDTLRKANANLFGGSSVYEYLKNKTEPEKPNLDETHVETSINKDGSFSSNKLLRMNEEQCKDADYLLKAHGFDPSSWKMVSCRNTIRQAISKDEGVVTLYASFITVKPTQEGVSLEKIAEFFNKLDRQYSIPDITRSLDYLNGDKLLLIDIADLHMNLQATMFTTGNEYNCEIAEKLFFYVLTDIISRTSAYKFDEIIFTVGGDMLNGDNLLGSTTKGTPQNSDMHYYDAYEKLCEMTIKAIDILKDCCNKVSVIYVMGNHDEVTGFKLAKYIDAWFRNEPKVEVDCRPQARKYKLYGKTLMCFAHDGKVAKLPSIIADEARELWSKADTTEVFLQHLHTEQVLLEDNNIRIQRLPTISGRSKWSADKGYNSKRQCKSFIFDKDDGLKDVLYTPIKNI